MKAQPYMDVDLWKDPKRYIENSPIFFADKVSCPLLIMHNKQDVAVPWLQSVEYYLGLRFLGKSVWMLQYDNGGHELDYETEALDYTKRLIQYFDHYLKGKTCT